MNDLIIPTGSAKTSSHNQLTPFMAKRTVKNIKKHGDIGSDKIFPELIIEYFEIEVTGLSPLTVKAKKEDLDKLLIFYQSINGNLNASQWMPRDTKLFLHELEHQNYKPASLNRILATLRTFGKWLRDQGVIKVDPCRKIKEYQIEDFEPKRITEIEFHRMMKTSELLINNKQKMFSQHYRNKAIILLLNNTGLRINEVLNLKLEQFQFNGKKLVSVKSKGGKIRNVVKISKEVASAIRKYLKTYRTSGTDCLFTNRYGNRLSRNGFAKALDKVAGIANISLRSDGGERITPHKFRHSVGYRSRQLKGDVWAAKRLGHSSLNYIGRYGTLDNEEEEELVEKL